MDNSYTFRHSLFVLDQTSYKFQVDNFHITMQVILDDDPIINIG